MNIKYIKTTDNKKYDLRDKRIVDTDNGVATQSTNGLLSSTDKKKLDGIASGAEVNQNAFSNIKIGNTTIVADGKTDTVELTAGNNIAITPDATNDKITIAASHADTSSQASVSNSGRTYIQSVTLDGMGHVTGLSSATETVVNTDRYVNNAAFADDSASAPASPVKMTLTRAGSDTATVTANLPKVSSASAGVAPKGAAVTIQGQSTKFLREDGTWAAPSYSYSTVKNHYAPAEDTSSQLDADASSTTAATWNSTSLVTGVTVKRDAKGHVVGLGVDSIKMPANPNTDTKVTSAANHYAPATVSGQDKSASASGGTAGWSVDVVKGVTLNTDGKGHVTGLSVTSAKIPANPVSPNTVTGPASSTDAHVAVFNGATGKAIKDSGFTIAKSVPSNAVFTDVAVLQRLASSYLDLPLLMAVQTTSNTTGDIYGFTYRNNSIYANPATGTITANKFNGSSTHAYTSSQSGFVENHGDNLEHYWMKLWEIDVNAKYVDRDITFLLQSAYQERQGTLHIRTRRDIVGGSSRYFVASMRLTSGNIDKTRVRLYYNNSTGNCQLWYDCGERWGCINAKMLHKTLRNSGEVQTLGTMYSTSTTTVQELPGTGYKYVEPTYAVYAEWNDVQNKPSSDAGSATQPVYFSGGVPIACSYQLNKTVPSNAVFTDTHYTTHLYAGSGTAANAATTNGNTKLTVVDDTTTRNSVTIKGTGGTTVTSDASGIITINSTDTSCKQFTFLQPTRSDDGYYFIISPKGNATVTPSGTCYFVEITALINNGPDSYVTRSAKFMTHCYWFNKNAGLRITDPVYKSGAMSACPILYHSHAVGTDVGTETYNYNVCNIPFKLSIETGLMSVNIKVEGPDVSECTCSRSYTSFKWPAVEPDWGAV